MGQTTITVQEDTLQHFKRLKAELNDAQDGPDHNANTFLMALLDTWEAVEHEHYQDQARAETLEEIKNQLEGMDPQQQTLEGRREIINRLDDLETELKTTLEGLR